MERFGAGRGPGPVLDALALPKRVGLRYVENGFPYCNTFCTPRTVLILKNPNRLRWKPDGRLPLLHDGFALSS